MTHTLSLIIRNLVSPWWCRGWGEPGFPGGSTRGTRSSTQAVCGRRSSRATSKSVPRVISVRVSVMLVSCGNPVQPAAEADEHAGGAEDVLDAVQQPAPATQRPGVGQVGDGLLHQRAQPCLQAVVGPLGVAEAVDGAAVPDRGMPVLAGLGQPAEPPVQQAGDLDIVEQPLQPCKLDQLMLVAAAWPAAV